MKNSGKVKLALTALTAASGLAMTMGPSIKLTAQEIARAWESSEYRSTLSAEQLQQLPSNPAGDLIIQQGDDSHPQLIARSTSDDCRTTGDGCRSTSDSCRTTSDTCRSTSDTCSTQFGSCELA